MKNAEAYFQPTVNDPFIPKEGTIWRHSKTGNLYRVKGWARHTEIQDEILIIYERLSGGDGSIWARPEKMWDTPTAGDLSKNEILRRFEFVSQL